MIITITITEIYHTDRIFILPPDPNTQTYKLSNDLD